MVQSHEQAHAYSFIRTEYIWQTETAHSDIKHQSIVIDITSHKLRKKVNID